MGCLRLFLFALATAALLSACRPQPPASNAAPISRVAALEIGRKAAAASGYDLAIYKLDTFGKGVSEDQTEWVFGYLCSPGPPPPGCNFLVVVDRKTGQATVYPGE